MSTPKGGGRKRNGDNLGRPAGGGAKPAPLNLPDPLRDDLDKLIIPGAEMKVTQD